MEKLCIILLIALFISCNTKQARYKDPSAPINERVEDLLSRMSDEEKVWQIVSFGTRDTSVFDKEGNFIGTKDTAFLKHGVGTFWAGSKRIDPVYFAKCLNSVQKYMLEKTRLGIPLFFFAESLHGYMAPGATSYPQAIALGCTWDTTLVEQLFSMAALEERTRGTNQVLSPVLDLAREPRWGRTEECYSEDPWLTSRIALAAVLGLQGREKTIDNKHVAVTLKHFAGHGQPEGGRNIAPVNYSERMFRETHLYPFEIAVKRGNPQSIMASYNEWDGVPNHLNKKLLTGILANEWGFKGYVMSDGGGLDVNYRDHFAVADSAESGRMSLEAGVDFDLGSNGCFVSLIDQIKKGKVNMQALDRAVRNVLRVKFTLGLFENPYADLLNLEKITNCKAHKELALKAAHEAMVLLKNAKNTLPLDTIKIKTIAVIGPNAADIHLGGYSNPPMKGVSVLEGFKAFGNGKLTVKYAEGCKLTLNKECHWLINENPILNSPEDDKRLIAEAVNLARSSDAVVLALGENELICREAWSEEHLGDRDNLDLVGMQNDLVKAILSTGKPVVILLFNGRPMTINYLTDNAPAIIECFYLGQETGHAVADVVFGKVNPSGKLSTTFPRSVGQLPCYYNRKPSMHRSYVLADSKPLFPFGFGLSYTRFDYKNLQISPSEIVVNGNAEVTVEVTNTGKMAGDEIVQLYIHDKVSFPTRPIIELRDFVRINLKPGETKTVKFLINPEKLQFYDIDMKRIVQPGDFEIMAGRSSVDYLMGILKVK